MPHLPEKGIFAFPNILRRDEWNANNLNEDELAENRNFFDQDENNTDCEESYFTEEEKIDEKEDSKSEDDSEEETAHCFGEELWTSFFGRNSVSKSEDSNNITLATKHIKSPVNPFYHRIHLSLWDKVKVIL